MRIFQKTKDGGPESPVNAYFLCEFKSLFSIAILEFNPGRREEFHSHAFNALTWFIKGDMHEELPNSDKKTPYKLSPIPKLTKKSKTHRVYANKKSWCLTLRGPWSETWTEYNQETNDTKVLTHGRKEVESHNEV